jgi:hypothetical protein
MTVPQTRLFITFLILCLAITAYLLLREPKPEVIAPGGTPWYFDELNWLSVR